MSSVAAVHPRASSFPHRRRDARGGPRSRAVARAAPSSDSDRSFAIGSPVVAESSRRGALLGAAASALLLPARPAAADDLFCGYYTENKSVTPQWAFKTPWSEGVVDVSSATGVKDAKTFLRILGKQEVAESAGHLPVLCLHGGPGLGFKYMEACEILASDKREVASYDQLGCARSALRSAPRAGTFTPQLYAAELARLRTVAGLDKVHIVAHGWGAMLAIDHVLGVDGQRGVGGVASLTLVSLPPVRATRRRSPRRVVATPPKPRRGSPGRRRRFARRQSHPRGEGVVRQGLGGMDRAIRIVARGGGVLCGVIDRRRRRRVRCASRKTGDEGGGGVRKRRLQGHDRRKIFHRGRGVGGLGRGRERAVGAVGGDRSRGAHRSGERASTRCRRRRRGRCTPP